MLATSVPLACFFNRLYSSLKEGYLSPIFILCLTNIGLNKVCAASLLEIFSKFIYFYRISSSLTMYSWISKNKYSVSPFLVLRVAYIVYTHPSSYI